MQIFKTSVLQIPITYYAHLSWKLKDQQVTNDDFAAFLFTVA